MRNLASVFLVAAVMQAQPASKQAEVDKLFAAFNTHTPGCAVGVAEKGAVMLRAGYGMADLERNVAITADTVFESGSVAKQFTAAALLLLAQQGKIALDDPLRKYLPELPDYGTPVTIRQVLSHVSGLREWRPVASFGGVPEGMMVLSNQDLLRMAAKQKALNFEPGTHYSYTNTGFNISTILIERALGNGETFETFTKRMIFDPLAMTHTRWRDDFRAVVPNRALAYGHSGGEGWTQQTPIENIIGAGGLLTTVDDLLRWNENFTHAKVGGAGLVQMQQTPAVLKGGPTIPYAAGLAVATFDGVKEVAHSGATGGYRTWLGRYPEQGVSVAVLCNSAGANPTHLGRETARLWTGAAKGTAAAASYTADAAKMQAEAGMYRRVRDNTVMRVRWQDGKLKAEPGGELVATGPGTFRSATTEYTYVFSDKMPAGLRVETPMGDMQYEQVEPAQPGEGELRPLVGEYESKETGSTVTVAMGPKRGELEYRIGANAAVVLRPTFRDGFVTREGAAIRFIRDGSGKVVGFSAGEDRVWDLRFTRVR